jgi:hypothetical protein
MKRRAAAWALTALLGVSTLTARRRRPAARGPPTTGAVASPAATPFGPGERMEYQVKLGVANVGNGHMEVHGIESIRGNQAYHVSMGIKGGLRFVARVDNLFESWMDVETLASHRFIQDQDELRTQRHRQFDFFHAERRFERADGEESGGMITNRPLDDISFVYYARTLPLEVGETYTLNHYFRPDRNPVVIRVLRKDRIDRSRRDLQHHRGPAGHQDPGLFSEGGEAEIHFSDDNRRLMVYMRSRVPGMNLSLHLREYTPGRPLRAFSAGGSAACGHRPASPGGGRLVVGYGRPLHDEEGGPAELLSLHPNLEGVLPRRGKTTVSRGRMRRVRGGGRSAGRASTSVSPSTVTEGFPSGPTSSTLNLLRPSSPRSHSMVVTRTIRSCRAGKPRGDQVVEDPLHVHLSVGPHAGFVADQSPAVRASVFPGGLVGRGARATRRAEPGELSKVTNPGSDLHDPPPSRDGSMVEIGFSLRAYAVKHLAHVQDCCTGTTVSGHREPAVVRLPDRKHRRETT